MSVALSARLLVKHHDLASVIDRPKKRADYTGLIAAAGVLPVYLTFYFRGQESLGETVCLVLMCALIAIRVRWDLRRRAWFWAVMFTLVALQIPALLVLRWPQHVVASLPSIGLLPIGLAELLVMLAAVGVVERIGAREERIHAT